jgi:hypothetical protein
MGKRLRLVGLSLTLFATLGAASCGGGGGGSGSAAQSPTGRSFDLAAGLANLAASEVKATVSVSGTSNGSSPTGTAQLTQSAAIVSTFNGTPASAQTTALTGMYTDVTGEFSVSYSFVQYDSSSDAILGLDTDFNSVLEDQTTQFNYALTAAGSMSLQSLSIAYPATARSLEQTLVYTVQQ